MGQSQDDFSFPLESDGDTNMGIGICEIGRSLERIYDPTVFVPTATDGGFLLGQYRVLRKIPP
jgi:hypothetical protein